MPSSRHDLMTSLTAFIPARWPITRGNPRFLDRQYTAFGKLIKGDDVLEKIATTPTHPQDRPNKRMGVESIKIVPADSVK